MVSWISTILIFFVVLFFYIHIQFHLKKVNDLDVYEIHVSSKQQLEKICDFKQPTSFHIILDSLPTIFNKQALLESHTNNHVKIRKVQYDVSSNKNSFYTELPLKSALSMCSNNTNDSYIIERNSSFLKDTNLNQNIKKADSMLRPYMVSQCKYDFILGSNNSYTPLRYDLNYRNYYYVTEGSVKVKLTPPCSSEYLTEHNNYDLFEFISDYNPWVKHTSDNIKWIEVTLQAGEILFVPAYWWSSILLNENSTIVSLKYQTYISMLSILPKLATHFLQKQNIKHIISEKKQQNPLSFVKSKDKKNDTIINKTKSKSKNNNNLSKEN